MAELRTPVVRATATVKNHGRSVANPTSCRPVAYFGSVGLGESGNSQTTQTDQFAKWNGCTIETLPTAAKGSHVCTSYTGCPALDPVRWCSYDGGHTSAPTDSGQSTSVDAQRGVGVRIPILVLRWMDTVCRRSADLLSTDSRRAVTAHLRMRATGAERVLQFALLSN